MNKFIVAKVVAAKAKSSGKHYDPFMSTSSPACLAGLVTPP
jgi:hypothetical protein